MIKKVLNSGKVHKDEIKNYYGIKLKNQFGITLIALIITIIILLILAGITINLALDDDGIIKRAGKVANMYEESQKKEIEQLGMLLANLVAGQVAKVENNIQYVGDGNGNIIPVPIGFSYLEGTKETGFVIKNDDDENEFVWIPVEDIKDYERVSWNEGRNADIVNVFLDSMPEDEEKSVSQFKGYYIGRYETGIAEYTSLSTDNTNNSTEWTGYSGGKIVIKKGQQIWRYITKNKAEEISKSLYNKAKNNVISKMCSSFAWDTAIKFINTTNSTYAEISPQGNFEDIRVKYTENGEEKIKEVGEEKLLLTGQTIAVNNIYDMGGNIWEWSTETAPNDVGGKTCVDRGGCFMNKCIEPPDKFSAGSRANDFPWRGNNVIGFRICLFL